MVIFDCICICCKYLHSFLPYVGTGFRRIVTLHTHSVSKGDYKGTEQYLHTQYVHFNADILLKRR